VGLRQRHVDAKTWPSETGDELSLNMPPSGMKENNVCSGQSGETMPVPAGRFEKRVAKAVTVEIRLWTKACLREDTDRKRESSRCTRLMEREWRPAAGGGYLSEGRRAGTGADCLLRAFGEKQICCRVGTVRPVESWQSLTSAVPTILSEENSNSRCQPQGFCYKTWPKKLEPH